MLGAVALGLVTSLVVTTAPADAAPTHRAFRDERGNPNGIDIVRVRYVKGRMSPHPGSALGVMVKARVRWNPSAAVNIFVNTDRDRRPERVISQQGGWVGVYKTRGWRFGKLIKPRGPVPTGVSDMKRRRLWVFAHAKYLGRPKKVRIIVQSSDSGDYTSDWAPGRRKWSKPIRLR